MDNEKNKIQATNLLATTKWDSFFGNKDIVVNLSFTLYEDGTPSIEIVSEDGNKISLLSIEDFTHFVAALCRLHKQIERKIPDDSSNS